MIHYFESFLPKVLSYSQKLDKLALLLDEPWVMAGDSQTQTKLIFRTGGSILVSENGAVAFGKWEPLNRADSILIDYGHSAKLYNHGFFDEAVLALKLDGTNDFFVLVNQNRVPDLNVVGYLKDKYVKETRPTTSVTSSATSVDSKTRELEKNVYTTDKGEITVHSIPSWERMPSKGDKVYMNDKSAPNGKYEIAFMHYVHINDGLIVKITLL